MLMEGLIKYVFALQALPIFGMLALALAPVIGPVVKDFH